MLACISAACFYLGCLLLAQVLAQEPPGYASHTRPSPLVRNHCAFRFTAESSLVVFVTHKDAKSSICDACAADLVPKSAYMTPVQRIW